MGPEFIPPCCPNPRCPHHHQSRHWRWRRIGSFRRKSDRERVARFRCARCGRSFSAQTFSTTYWLRRRDLLVEIARLSVSCASLRQIARHLAIAHTTVARHLARLGRHAMLFHRAQLQGKPLSEPIAFDGFETFEFSQFFPNHFHLAAGTRSWVLYHFTDSPLRRKGRMTPEQRCRRELIEHRFGRPDPKAVERDVAELLTTVLSHHDLTRQLDLHSDEHPAYPRAIGRVLERSPAPLPITHHTTPSSAPRTIHNPLFAVNLADLLIRHTGANHKRETIAFSRRRQAAAERLAVHLVWRNYIKPRREKKPPATAAMAAKLADEPLSWARILAHRLFPSKIPLPPRWAQYYHRLVRTAVYPLQDQHRCRYAF